MSERGLYFPPQSVGRWGEEKGRVKSGIRNEKRVFPEVVGGVLGEGVKGGRSPKRVLVLALE